MGGHSYGNQGSGRILLSSVTTLSLLRLRHTPTTDAAATSRRIEFCQEQLQRTDESDILNVPWELDDVVEE
jgi:hypothetical protein